MQEMNGDNHQLLATHVARLSGAQFEEFCISWLIANQNLPFLGGNLIHAQPFGRPGQNQHGIDIACDVERPADSSTLRRIRVVAQCKRVKEWTDQQTLDAIAKATHPADEYVLILALPTDEKIQRVIDLHNDSLSHGKPRWSVWFIDAIQRQIETHLQNDKGARLLTEYFGSDVSFDLIRLHGSTPLMIADAFFAGMQGTLQHRHELIGRTEELNVLLSFLDNEEKQALILTASGGEGKTRLLAELARCSADENPARCVRWLEECTPEALDEALRWLPPSDQIVIILDDVHRWTNAPEQIFTKLRRQGSKLKLVIGTRPYRSIEIENALIHSGILADQQMRPPALQPLKQQDLLRMAEQALQPEKKRLADPLVEASGGSPLILLLGAEHVNRAQSDYNLHQDINFRRTLLTKLIDPGKLAAQVALNSHQVNQWVSMMALLSSAPLSPQETNRLNAIADLSSSEAERLEELLKREGYLVTRQDRRSNETQHRLVPDLMADYLACGACFDELGKARDLPRRLWQELGSPTLLPAVLRNLSEAEYIVRLSHPNADKVTAPFTTSLREQYESASWAERVRLLEIWKSIAIFHPEEAFKQVRQASKLRTTQPLSADTSADAWLESFINQGPQDVDRTCADILEIVGSHHEEMTRPCLDQLWSMDQGRYGELLTKIGGICSLARTLDFNAAEIGISWVKDRLSNPAELPNPTRLGALLGYMLDWCFFLKGQNTRQTDRTTLEIQTIYYPIAPTRKFRQEALNICEMWLRSNIQPARLAAGHLLRQFFVTDGMAIKAGDGGTVASRKAWRREEEQALNVVASVVSNTQDASTLWVIRHTLIDALPYVLHQKSGRHGIHEILESFPDSFEQRVHRLFLSNEDSDSWDDEEWCAHTAHFQASKTASLPWNHAAFEARRTRQRQAWSKFVKLISTEILRRVKTTDQLSAFLCEWQIKLEAVGTPRFGTFLSEIVVQHPNQVNELMEQLLTHPLGKLDHLFSTLLHALSHASQDQSSFRLRALRCQRPTLIVEALRSLRFRQALVPDELTAIQFHADNASLQVRRELVSWAAEWAPEMAMRTAVFTMLSELAIHDGEDELNHAFLNCLKSWMATPFPQPGIPHGEKLLSRFVQEQNLGDTDLDKLIVSWSRHEPAQVISFLQSRIAEETRRRTRGDSEYLALPYQLHLHTLESLPEVDEKLVAAFNEIRSTSSSSTSADLGTLNTWFETLARGAWTTYLNWLSGSLANLHGETLLSALQPIGSRTRLAFTHPDLIEQLLRHTASETDSSIRDRVKWRLVSSLHPGFHEASPGQPRAHDLASREKALELSKQYRQRPLLRDFYLSIVQSSERSIETAKRESPWE